ncbi:MAG: type IV secretion system protein, partial [Streptosporangiaceae bacterium]
MTRFVPRKSLLVLGLLVTVFGSSAAAAFAAAQPTASAATPAASRPVTVTVPQASGQAWRQGNAAASGVLHAVTTAYSSGASADLINTTAPAGPVPTATTPGIEPTGICSVPGIGSIASLLGDCASGSGSSGLLGGLNSICTPSLPQPEPANGGIDSIVSPPATSGTQGKTLYDSYGVAGQYWAPYGLQCSDMTSLIGNNVAGMVFDASKAVDRVTITVYQSAAGNGILSWLANVVNRLITSIGNAIYFPYLIPVVLLGVVWLAWNGLVLKRASRTIEGTIWMVIACVAAIWLISQPGDFTGFGQSVSNGVTQVLNVAFSKLPGTGAQNCVPVGKIDPQSAPIGNYGFTQGNGMVDQNANELWGVLVCKPWLAGEFGTTAYSTGKNGQTPVNTYGRQLLWAQAIATNEKPTAALIQAKQSTYAGIASSIKQNDPSIYPLFQGNQWTSRLEIGFAALFAALVAGVLILLIAVTLIILKLGFLLLLIAGPFFLIVGTHPGFGRVVAIRWVE